MKEGRRFYVRTDELNGTIEKCEDGGSSSKDNDTTKDRRRISGSTKRSPEAVSY